jgi:1-acyl-sn-glycerol-3-phosphate acyltransferase
MHITKKCFRSVVKAILPLIARIDVKGAENLKRDDSFIIAANHLGQLDGALIYYLIDRNDLMYLVNDKYKNHPFLGRFLVSIGGLYIKRNAQNIRAIRKALEHTKSDGILIITPEGVRSPTGALQRGKSGVAFFACKLNRPIVPVGITGTEDWLVIDNLKHFRNSHIIVTVGKAFNLPPQKRKTLITENAADEIMCQIAVMLPESYRGVYAEHSRVQYLLNN